MLEPKQLHPYQRRAIAHVLEHDQSMLHLDPGLGKTTIMLTAKVLRQEYGEPGRTLIVAPLRPARGVWSQEARRWTHTQHLTFSFVLGTAEERLKALFVKADYYVINYENLVWLATMLTHHWLAKGLHLPFDEVIWDEISMMKNQDSKRVEGFLSILPYIKRRVGLTGTPAANGLMDLHGQYLMVDSGLRLGMDRSLFKQRFFHAAGPYNLEPDADAVEHIAKVVGDITLEMREEDYLTLPPVTVNDIELTLPAKLRDTYDQLELQFFIELEEAGRMEVENAAAMINKLLQFSAGAVYPDPESRDFEKIHDIKLDALESIYKETGDEPLLVAYQFKSDAARIKERFPDTINLSGTDARQTEAIIDSWVKGEIKMLIGHPKSMGHGTDRLQYNGRHMVWFGLTWSLEFYIQFYKRLVRQGQTERVIMHRLIMLETADEIQRLRLAMKGDNQNAIRDAIHLYREMR